MSCTTKDIYAIIFSRCHVSSLSAHASLWIISSAFIMLVFVSCAIYLLQSTRIAYCSFYCRRRKDSSENSNSPFFFPESLSFENLQDGLWASRAQPYFHTSSSDMSQNPSCILIPPLTHCISDNAHVHLTNTHNPVRLLKVPAFTFSDKISTWLEKQIFSNTESSLLAGKSLP